MKSIYIFSGLGADKRVFQFMDFSGFDITFIEWIQPAINETIENYAQRLVQQIKTPLPILIGLSFGGMIAIEVAKLINTEKIILIASAKGKQEIPFYYRITSLIRLHKLLPSSLLKQPSFFNNWLFGTKTSQDKKLLAEILNDTDSKFIKWALAKIGSWSNTTEHKNLKHIHGTADRILPIRYVGSHIKVDNGGHFMTVNKATELTKLVRKELDEYL